MSRRLPVLFRIVLLLLTPMRYKFAELFVSLHPRPIKTFKRMGSIFIIQGILIYIYAFDHNPPHIHVRSGTDNFSITIQDRIIEGKARSKTVKIIRSALPLA